MGVYKLSEECKLDIANIYEFGIEKFGLNQAKQYILGLNDLFQTLDDNVDIGRDATEFASGLKRVSYKSHMVFYLVTRKGVLIVRTLNQSMDYERHL